MKERPILFSAAMVRALLAGMKTQTRRVVKPKGADHIMRLIGADDQPTGEWGWCPRPHVITKHVRCPYGHPGDLLWVRESLRYCPEYGHYFAAGDGHGARMYLCSLFDDPEKQTGYSYEGGMREGSVPSIHLPRRYSRITLRVTDVRVERLQDISRGDAMEEGCPFPNMAKGPNPRDWYADRWAQINGPDSWAANPWVWVITFERVTAS